MELNLIQRHDPVDVFFLPDKSVAKPGLDQDLAYLLSTFLL